MIFAVLETLFANPLLTLFVVIGGGLLLGKVEIGGVSLGSSGVVFVALLAGHLGATLPGSIGSLGLALFVYCVGISAGARFFGALKRDGGELTRLALVVVGAGAAVTWLLAALLDLDPDLAVGLFAGALTSTPGLAAATEAAGDEATAVIVGYGVAYPLGVIGVVLFVQLVPRLLRLNLEKDDVVPDKGPEIVRQLVEVTNPNMVGKNVGEAMARVQGCQVARIWKQDRLEPVKFDDVLQEGQPVFLVGEAPAVELATDLLGQKSERETRLDADNERRQLVITDPKLRGQTINDLAPLQEHSVVITRIQRMEFTLAPHSDTVLEKNDVLTVVGPTEALEKFGHHIGHRSGAFSETSLISLLIGLALGVLLGQIPIPLPGGENFTLGLAGGPLFVALLLGHFGTVAGIQGYVPRPTRMLLQELGLVFFLADAGVKGGATIAEALVSQGPLLLLVGLVITLLPLVISYPVARRLLKLSPGASLGAICGGMTSTPALGAITSKTAAQSPILSYATIYPVAVILMALLAKLLIQLM